MCNTVVQHLYFFVRTSWNATNNTLAGVPEMDPAGEGTKPAVGGGGPGDCSIDGGNSEGGGTLDADGETAVIKQHVRCKFISL